MNNLIPPLANIVKSYLCNINDDDQILKYDPELLIYRLNICCCDYEMNSMIWLNAKHGNLDNIKWLYDNHFSYDAKTFNEAAGYGDINVLIWLLEHNFPHDKQDWNNVENKEAIHWLSENDLMWEPDYTTKWI